MVAKTFRIVGSAILPDEQANACPDLSIELEKLGHFEDNSGLPEIFISINHNATKYRQFIQSGGRPSQAVLIRLEPDSVFPLQYRSTINEKYGLIITPGSVNDFREPLTFVGWPYKYNLNPTLPSKDDPSLSEALLDSKRKKYFNLEEWQSRENKIVMIAGNKVSPLKSSNYTLRRRLSNAITSGLLDTYGPLWNDNLKTKMRHRLAVAYANIRHGIAPNFFAIYGDLFRVYPHAKGVIADKHELIGRSKFSLVIENSNTYISEKLLDAIFGGSIPIYVGPKLEDVGLPPSLAFSTSGDPREILNFVNSTKPAVFLEMLESMKKFIDSSTFRELWTSEGVYSKISAQIDGFYGRKYP